jgi:hypothetical protein
MIEPRRELCFAHETPLAEVVPLMQHLDDYVAAEERLICTVNGPESTTVELLSEQVLTEHPTAMIFGLIHRAKR